MKKLYYLSYDLIKDKDYQKLYDELKRYGAIRVLESVWAFKYAENNANAFRDHFNKFIDLDDRLLVIESSASSWRNLMADPNSLK